MNTKDLEQIKETLKSNNCRITQSRLAVATILIQNSEQLLSCDDIFNKIQKSKKFSCDQVSVYRVLATFENLGLVKKNTFQGDATRYGLQKKKCEHEGHHEHYFKCIKCDVIEPFQGCLVSKMEQKLEEKGYKNLSHHLEITGLCPKCAQATH